MTYVPASQERHWPLEAMFPALVPRKPQGMHRFGVSGQRRTGQSRAGRRERLMHLAVLCHFLPWVLALWMFSCACPLAFLNSEREKGSALVSVGCEQPCGCWKLSFDPSARGTSVLNCQAISRAPHPVLRCTEGPKRKWFLMGFGAVLQWQLFKNESALLLTQEEEAKQLTLVMR